MIRALLVACALLSVAMPRSVAAATRTVCFELALRDQRSDCPLSGEGVRRVCNSDGPNELPPPYNGNMGGTGWVHPVGMEVELWDKDAGDGSADDYIGTWRHQDAETCVTFNWEGASYAEGEANPDVYVKVKNRVLYAGSLASIRIVKGDGTLYSDVSSRNGWSGNSDAGTAVDCTAGVQCEIASGVPVWILSNPATDQAQALMALDSAERILPVYYTQLDPGIIDLQYPSAIDYCNPDPAPEYPPVGITYTRTKVHLCSNAAHRGTLPTHELGHLLQGTQFGVDPSAVAGDYTRNGDGWKANVEEYDSAATSEGWADYVAAVAWWNPENGLSDPIVWGWDVEKAAPEKTGSCDPNNDIPIQVARTFWDLDDTYNESYVAPATYSDNVDLSTLTISAAWGNFPSGSGNRHYGETGQDRLNIWDYYVNAGLSSTAFIYHNCIQSQAW